MVPIWNQAIEDGKMVEVPFTINGQIFAPSITGDKKNLGKQRLLIDKKGNTPVSYIVNYMPAIDFKGDIKAINIGTYKRLKFKGYVSVFTLNNENLGAFVFEDGKIKNKLKGRNVSGLSPRTSCSIEQYDCYCGRVLDGDLQCSTCIAISCYDEQFTTGDGGGGGPLYSCEPFCGNGGGPPVNETTCPSVAFKTYTNTLGTVNFSGATVTFLMNLSNVNINTGSYSWHIQKQIGSQTSTSVTFSDEGIKEKRNEMFNCTRIIALSAYGVATMNQLDHQRSSSWELWTNFNIE
jgi:hypothetical protein